MGKISIDLTPDVLADLERALSSMAEQSKLGRVPALARAVEPHVSASLRTVITRALEERTSSPTWIALYPESGAGPVSSDESVPGESTLAEEGGYAFERDTIRRFVRVAEDALDLRQWLAMVPPVHAAFALTGARKIVAHLQTTSVALGDALLDAFSEEMSAWARANDPALELSVVAIP